MFSWLKEHVFQVSWLVTAVAVAMLSTGTDHSGASATWSATIGSGIIALVVSAYMAFYVCAAKNGTSMALRLVAGFLVVYIAGCLALFGVVHLPLFTFYGVMGGTLSIFVAEIAAGIFARNTNDAHE